VAVEELTPGGKETRILSVGRFFAGQHNKRHMLMVEAFRALVDGGVTGWELHLAGGLTPGAAHAAYLEDVRRAAAGYPIVVHVDVPFDELRSLYAHSAIYWHAAGFGYDEETDPIRFEHFGITTVEAMAAGCVPVVYAAGGQRELVADSVTGYGWRTLAELRARTEQLIADPALRARLADGAVLSSQRFDWAHFRQRLVETLAEADSPVRI
jgi:glycosyltransferase involved in cell wall biosynthesis